MVLDSIPGLDLGYYLIFNTRIHCKQRLLTASVLTPYLAVGLEACLKQFALLYFFFFLILRAHASKSLMKLSSPYLIIRSIIIVGSLVNSSKDQVFTRFNVGRIHQSFHFGNHLVYNHKANLIIIECQFKLAIDQLR